MRLALARRNLAMRCGRGNVTCTLASLFDGLERLGRPECLPLEVAMAASRRSASSCAVCVICVYIYIYMYMYIHTYYTHNYIIMWRPTRGKIDNIYVINAFYMETHRPVIQYRRR